MAKILGEPFDTHVNDQITVRQTRLGQNQKTSDDLVVFNASTPWIRLSSSVSVGKGRATELVKNIGGGISLEDVVGGNLAKNLVLFAGSSEGAGGTQKGGLTRGGLKGAYGFLTDPKTQGYKPMPGITSISTNYRNNGSLKQAQVNLKCFSKGQFEAIETLYLRLGYTLTLEYGHSIYYDNGTKKQNMSSLEIPNALFLKGAKGANLNVLLNESIVKNKKNTGCNYDAIIAKVSNFSWKLNPDLSYDIVLNLISVGDIIDSLKMNLGGVGSARSSSTQAVMDVNLQNILQIRLAKDATLLNAFLYDLTERITSNEAQTEVEDATVSYIETENLIERANDLIPVIKEKYTAVINEQIRKYITPFQDLRNHLLKYPDVKSAGTYREEYVSPYGTGIVPAETTYTGAWIFNDQGGQTSAAIQAEYEKLVKDLPIGRLRSTLLGETVNAGPSVSVNSLTFLNSLNLRYTPTLTTTTINSNTTTSSVMSVIVSTEEGLEKVRNYINNELAPLITKAGTDSQGEVIPGQEAVNTVGEIAYLSIQSKTTEQIEKTLYTLYISGFWDNFGPQQRFPHKDLQLSEKAISEVTAVSQVNINTFGDRSIPALPNPLSKTQLTSF